MGNGASGPPPPMAPRNEPTDTQLAAGSSRVIKSASNLTSYLEEIAKIIVQKKAVKFELAETLRKDMFQAEQVMNTPIPTGDYSGMLMIHVLALYNIDDEEASKLIVQLTRNINATLEPDGDNHGGGSPLHLCATANNAAVASHILLNRTDAVIDLRDSQGMTALHRSIVCGSTAVARLIIRKYPELCDQTVAEDPQVAGSLSGMNPLHLSVVAALNNPPKIREFLYSFVDFLLRQGCDVNARDGNSGGTPVHYAAARGVNDLLYLMLNSRDVKDSIDDSAGLNALHVAAISNQLVPINMLLMRGFNVNSRGARGETALMVAAMANSNDAIRHLIEKGADAKLADDTGATALHYAAATASPDACFEILNLTELDINTVDENGGTALHTLALRYTTLEKEAANKTCQILLDFAIEKDICDAFGNRAYKYLPAEDQDAQALFGRSHLYLYDTFHDRRLEDDDQVRLPLGLPRLPVSRNWLEEMVKSYGQGAEEAYRRDFEKRLYYFPGEPRRTPVLEREPEWWPSEQAFPYTEANKILADRQDIGIPRYPAVTIPVGPDPLRESFDIIAPKLDHYGNVVYKDYQLKLDRSHEQPTRVRPDRRTIEITKDELLKRNYADEVLDEQNAEEQQMLDQKHSQKWWMRSDVRNQIDRMPARKRPSAVPPGMAKDEMLLQTDIEFPPDVDVRNQMTDAPINRTPEEWVRDPPADIRAAQVRRPPTATRAVFKDPNDPANIKFEDQWRPQAAQPPPPQQQPPQLNDPQTTFLYAPDGQPLQVVARPDGEPEVRVIRDPYTGQPIQVVEGPGGTAVKVYEAPNGKPVIMAAQGNQPAIVYGPDGNAIRISKPVGPGRRPNSAATSSVVSSRLGTPTPRRKRNPDEEPTRIGPEQLRAAGYSRR